MMTAEPIEIDWNRNLSIFASEPFLKSVGDEYGWLGGLDESGTLRCILPYTVIRKGSISMVRFRVETIPLDEHFAIQEEKEFLNSAVGYFRTKGYDLVIPATTNTIFRTYPEGAIAAPYGTYVIDLKQPEEAIWSNFSSSHRRKVRLAVKEGVQIQCGLDHLETSYRLVRDTFKRSRMKFMGYDAFKRYVSGLSQNVRIMVAVHQGKVQGAIVAPFSIQSAYYVYGGSTPEPVTGSTNLLHWEAMRQFKALGVGRYDFVGVRIDPEKGSKAEGLKSFKERFGGNLVRGYMWKCSLCPLKYGVYARAVRLLRGGDIVDQERHKL